jgi:hypothetical protein
MKEHWSSSAMHDATGQLIPHSTFTYFVTGSFSQAVEDGKLFAGLSGSWSMVDVHTFQTINHGVEPTDNALDCMQCHQELSQGNPTQMDLQGDLGYSPKGPLTELCIQCHEYKAPRGFRKHHDDHVNEDEDEKNFDCSWCHNFTRPERGLTLPNGQ